MTTCPDSVLRLIDRFTKQEDQVRSPDYNETQLRIDFINPLFGALGWDMDNKAGYAERYRDVVHEDRVKVGGTTKAPDYSFRVGGQRKFFLEAKRPSVDIRKDWEPAYQLRRYAWSAKLTCSILTDFEELAIYDARVRPRIFDKPSVARREYVRCQDYPQRWDFIAGTFSKDAVLKGDFDRYIEAKRGRGAEPFDEAFLQEIEAWRLSLASSLAGHNQHLDQAAINFSVQRIIDRILFLRIAEDRGTEALGQLRAVTERASIYESLKRLFRTADDRYNSGLFHFDDERDRAEVPDKLTLSLSVPDGVLKTIISGLYYPQSPYEFTVVAADILGSVYERFLGKAIVLDANHRAGIEDKPLVRKAGGVYYTPSYVVDFIVRATLGQALESASLREAARLRVIDPACGSGSFLIAAYQALLNWYLDQYNAQNPSDRDRLTEGKRAVLRPTPDGSLALTITERKRILTEHIFGIDLDMQAVEVTKLNLLLKCLEGETSQTLGFQQRLFQERALPDLGRNIVCGNSLVGTDFFDLDAWKNMEPSARAELNPVNLQEAFPQAFNRRNPGFDVIIGNPPYVLLQDEHRNDDVLGYFRGRFACATFKLDTYHLFMEQACRLVRNGGVWGLITPSNYLTNNHLEALRRALLGAGTLTITVIEGAVFAEASVDTAITIMHGVGESQERTVTIQRASADDDGLVPKKAVAIAAAEILSRKHALLTIAASPAENAILERLAGQSVPLGEIAHVNFGKQLRDREKYTRDVIECANGDVPKGYRACLTGRDVQRYQVRWNGLACLADEAARKGGCWDVDKHAGKPKLLTKQVGRHPEFGMDTEGLDCLNTVFMVNLLDRAYTPWELLGLLNSRLLRWVWKRRYYDGRETFPKIKGTYLKQIPVRRRSGDGASLLREIGRLAETIHRLKSRLATEVLPNRVEQLQRECKGAERQVDVLAYKAYGITDSESSTIEAALDEDTPRKEASD